MYICVIIYKLIIQNKEIIAQYIYSLIVNVSIYLFKLD